MAHRLVEQHPCPAAAHHHGHFAGRSSDGFEVHERLRQCKVDRPFPLGVSEELVVKIAPAEAVEAGLPAPILLDHDLHAEAH